LKEYYHIIYWVYFFVSLNGIYFIGHFILNLIDKKNNLTANNVFFKMLTGYLVILVPTSFFFTSFNTVHLALLIPFLFFVKQINFSQYFSFKINYNELILLNSLSLFTVFFQYIFYSKLGTLNLLPIDMNNHAQLSYFMGNGGFESKFAELNSLGAINTPIRTPYHYSEIWINVFLSKILPSTNIGYTLIFITYPLLYTTYLSGLYMLGRKSITNRFVLILLCVLGLFVGPLDFVYFRELFFKGHLFSNQTVIFENVGFFFNTLIYSYHGQKHIPFYLLSIIVIYFLINKDLKKAFAFLAIAPILNIGLLPGVFGAVILFSAFHFFNYRNLKKSFNLIIPTVLTTVFVLVYYRINGSYDSEKQTDLLFLNPGLNTKGIILKMILRVVYSCLLLLFIYFPVIFFVKKIKKNILSNDLFVFTFSLIISSLCTRLLLEGFNTPQFVTFILPFFNVYLIVLFLKNYSTYRLIVMIVIIFFFVINFTRTKFHTQTRRNFDTYEVYSKGFVLSVLGELKKCKDPRIAYLLGEDVFKTIQPGFWFGYYPCEFLFSKDYFKLYSINFPNYKYDLNSSKTNDFSPNHLRYFMSKTYNEKQYSDQLMVFIEAKKIQFLVCENNSEIPNSLRKNINDSIIDPKSGDKFYKIHFSDLQHY
jgi:hypothetical protein